MQTSILPSGRKMIPKHKCGRDEQLSERTSCRPCSFLGSRLSSASFTHSNSPDEIKAGRHLHVSMVSSLCHCFRVWLRLTFFLRKYKVTWLWVFFQSSAPVQSQAPMDSFWCPGLPPLSCRRSRSQTWIAVPPQLIFQVNIPHQSRGEETIFKFSTFWFLLLPSILLFFNQTESFCPLLFFKKVS